MCFEQQINLENEMESMKLPMLMSLEEYEAWRAKFECWVQATHASSWVMIETGYVIPRDTNQKIIEKFEYSSQQRNEYIAEKKMLNLLQQSVAENIMGLLPECDTAHKLWNALRAKYLSHAMMFNNKKVKTEVKTEVKKEVNVQIECTDFVCLNCKKFKYVNVKLLKDLDCLSSENEKIKNKRKEF